MEGITTIIGLLLIVILVLIFTVGLALIGMQKKKAQLNQKSSHINRNHEGPAADH